MIQKMKTPTKNNANYIIRPAAESDVCIISDLIRKLAEYEKLSAQVSLNEETLAYWLFKKQAAKVLLVEDTKKEVVAFALYFYNFSTFLGKPGIYLEDLYVLPPYRKQGIGKSIMVYLAQETQKKDLGRLEWSCLNWNKDSIGFYLSIAAESRDEWLSFRLSGAALAKLANSADGATDNQA